MPRAALVTICLALLLTSSARAQEQDRLTTKLGPLPSFTLTDQNGKPVSREDLIGRVCVVSFFFSCCNTICPTTQEAMAKLRDHFANTPDVLLVSINVYPSVETTEVLKNYADGRKADPSRWLFLRGSEAEVSNLVKNGFGQVMEKNPKAEPGREVTHSPFFMLVDSRGVIRGYVDGTDPKEVERLKDAVGRMVQAKYFPTVNAALNALCGVLLLAGFAFVKARWIIAHKAAMLAAVVVSAIFLGCYLYYHFLVLDGQPTRFPGEGVARTVYLAILLSHTLLAAAVAPLALRVTYLGLVNRIDKHRPLAKLTFPIWLYVSITGVIVYWMLYHLYPAA